MDYIRTMWTFLLLYASLYATSLPAKKVSSLSSNSIKVSEPTALSNSLPHYSNRTSSQYYANQTRVNSTNDRRGHQKDIMVVLPVMQGAYPDLNSSNLQMLYTKAPITAIIDDKKERTQLLFAIDKPPDREQDNNASKSDVVTATRRHPYTEFLTNKSPLRTNHSPLDYGYPDSYKFLQEFDDLPKNHKPSWTSTNQVMEQTIRNDSQLVTNSFAAASTTKGDPFQMFESVKPLEINKIFASKPAETVVASENVEETTTVASKKKYPEVLAKRPFLKRIPAKKPPINKIPNVHKLEEIQLVDSTIVTTPIAMSTTSPLTTAEMEHELYTAARYSTLFAESTKYFLPTPQAAILLNRHGEPLSKPITVTAAVSSSLPTWKPTTIETTTRSMLSDFWKPIDIGYSAHLPFAPSDSSSLGILLGDNSASSDTISIGSLQPLKDLTTRSPFPNDMLTNDMKNMLIALGILKSENGSVPVFTSPSSATTASTTTTEKPITKPKPIAAIIDVDSYSRFKKIPIDSHSPKEQKSPVSDDMRELLSSFGLLPLHRSTRTNAILTRISRQQHKLEALLNETNANKSESYNLFPDNMEKLLDNLGLLKPLARHYNPQRTGHVFQPNIHLEKLGDEQKVQKINEVIDTIRRLSKSKDIENLSIEELEKQLDNVTAVLKEDATNATNFISVNATKIESTLSEQSTTTRVVPKMQTTARRRSTTTPEPATGSMTITKRNEIIETTSTKNESLTLMSTSTSITVVTRKSAKRRPTTTTTTSRSLFTVTPVHELSWTNTATTQTTTTNPQTTTSQPPSSTFAIINDNNIRVDESAISAVKLSNVTTSKAQMNVIMTPPNPLSPDELLQFLEFNKNDVKRQQPNETVSNTSTTTTTMENISTTSGATLMPLLSSTNLTSIFTTETNISSESSTRSSAMDEQATNINPSISDLADSFGGGESTSEETSANNDFPTPRPNGLYFYLDWNTFLNVGEANNKPIRIRFSPRAGNPRLFLPITVP